MIFKKVNLGEGGGQGSILKMQKKEGVEIVRYKTYM